jgi:hypothetical protein
MSDTELNQALDHVDESYSDPLLDDCPVRPVGHNAGAYYFFDPRGQFRALTARNMNPAGLIDLFLGEAGWLIANFPPATKAATFNSAIAQAFLIRACCQHGILNADRALRGVGLWPDTEFTGDATRLVLHCGDQVAIFDPEAGLNDARDWHPAGQRIGKYAYAAAEPVARPSQGPLGFEAAQDLYDFIRTRWSWKSEISARLFFGAIVAGNAPGILPFRPTVLLVAEASSGKSTLQKLAKRLLLDLAHWRDNASAASIRKGLIGADARPLIVDEFEMPAGDDKNNRVTELLATFRSVFTQGAGGYARHEDAGRALNTIFMLGAIQPPPMGAADASRTVVLRLDRLDASADQIVNFEDALSDQAAKGPALWRRFLREWPRFEETFTAYRRQLIPKNPEVSRVGDTFGTLLACADMVLRADIRSYEEMKAITDQITEEVIGLTVGDSNAERCWAHLMTSHQANWHGGRKATFETMMQEAIQEDSPTSHIRAELKEWGILITDADGRIVAPRAGRGPIDVNLRCVAIAKDHSALNQVFARTNWQSGGYYQALASLPDAALAKSPQRFGNVAGSGRSGTARAVLIPCARILSDDDGTPPALPSGADPLGQDDV